MKITKLKWIRKLLVAIVEYQIRTRPKGKSYSFKIGDKVKYNWKSFLLIDPAADEDVHVIESFFADNAEFECGHGASMFWLRKLYPWENQKY